MTSIQWMIDELIKKNTGKVGNEYIEIFDKAKEMHKQEIMDAYIDRMNCTDKEEVRRILGEQYYQETFVSKGNYEHIVDINEMISDKEILDVAYDKYVIEDEIEAFIQGANWMQEQLKTK